MAEKAQHLKVIRERFLRLNEEYLKKGVSPEDLKLACEAVMSHKKNGSKSVFRYLHSKKLAVIILLPLLYSIVVEQAGIDFVIKYTQGTRCLIPNNYLIWEFTRPVSNCNFCRGVNSALVLGNVTREEFKKHAYSSKPIIVKKAASHWLASKVFSLQFFRSLYENIQGAYESVDEECQFLHFRSNFANLKEVFSMSERRAMNLPGEDTWYIGWKNCHPQVLEIMKKFYETPHFLPEDAEIPNTNYIFLGYDQGANMHVSFNIKCLLHTCWKRKNYVIKKFQLDYISRLMWQGQIIGSKTWTVAPTPECEDVCERFSFFVDTGDVILLDTRIWYHSTQVENGQFSLTITSEYG